jgi:hypothetical protein
VKRAELIDRTRQLVIEGERLQSSPTLGGLQVWLKLSDDLLVEAWGSMDRYHLAWLMVGKPRAIVRGRPMTTTEEASYVREVAAAKTAALQTSLDAVERHGMPFRGEDGGVAPGSGMGTVPGKPGGSAHAMTLAVGGTRSVPVPDAVARDYLLLALRLDQHIPGIVDGYFGPADLKATVDLEPTRTPSALVEEAAGLRERIAADDVVPESDRRRWLTAQLVAIEALAASLRPDPPAYTDLLERCFDLKPRRRADEEFAAAARGIDELLPGPGGMAERLAAWDASFVVPPERLETVVADLVATLRERAVGVFGAPDGEMLRVGLVRNQPWSAYNWYDGGLRSRVDLNVDLPIRATTLLHTIAHETYPGHHLEHAWKEADLVMAGHRLESSVLLINAAECVLSEGLGEVGIRFVASGDDAVDLLADTFRSAELPVAADRAAAREAAARSLAIEPLRSVLDACGGEAALRRHADGASHDEVLAYLQEVGGMSRDRASKRLDFIEHPLWRTYVHIYTEGAELIGRWLDGVPEPDRAARYGRLLHEQLTPGAILAEIEDAT